MNTSADQKKGMRLNQYLAECGVASRRKSDELIMTGSVEVDGDIIMMLGVRIQPGQDVRVNGSRVYPRTKVYLAMNKPTGCVCSLDDEYGRRTVLDLVPEVYGRIFPVGRLDRDSDGLLLLTNDGEFANHIAHPRYHVSKTYRVEASGVLNKEKIARMLKGIWLSEGRARFAGVHPKSTRGKRVIFEIVLQEGMNRQIRRVLAKLELKVYTLTRIAIGSLRLEGLPNGRVRDLTPKECQSLMQRKLKPATK